MHRIFVRSINAQESSDFPFIIVWIFNFVQLLRSSSRIQFNLFTICDNIRFSILRELFSSCCCCRWCCYIQCPYAFFSSDSIGLRPLWCDHFLPACVQCTQYTRAFVSIVNTQFVSSVDGCWQKINLSHSSMDHIVINVPIPYCTFYTCAYFSIIIDLYVFVPLELRHISFYYSLIRQNIFIVGNSIAQKNIFCRVMCLASIDAVLLLLLVLYCMMMVVVVCWLFNVSSHSIQIFFFIYEMNYYMRLTCSIYFMKWSLICTMKISFDYERHTNLLKIFRRGGWL